MIKKAENNDDCRDLGSSQRIRPSFLRNTWQCSTLRQITIIILICMLGVSLHTTSRHALSNLGNIKTSTTGMNHSAVNMCYYSPLSRNIDCMQKLSKKKRLIFGEQTQGRLLIFGDSTMGFLSKFGMQGLMDTRALERLKLCNPKYRCKKRMGDRCNNVENLQQQKAAVWNPPNLSLGEGPYANGLSRHFCSDCMNCYMGMIMCSTIETTMYEEPEMLDGFDATCIGMRCDDLFWPGTEFETASLCRKYILSNPDCSDLFMTYNSKNGGCGCYPTGMTKCENPRKETSRRTYFLTSVETGSRHLGPVPGGCVSQLPGFICGPAPMGFVTLPSKTTDTECSSFSGSDICNAECFMQTTNPDISCKANDGKLFLHGGFIPIEFARDVELQTPDDSTTQEVVSTFLRESYNTVPLVEDFGLPICIVNTGIHDAIGATREQFLRNVKWYVGLLTPQCSMIVWITTTAPATDEFEQKLNQTKSWNDGVIQCFREEGSSELLNKLFVVDVYAASINYTHTDNIHMEKYWYSNLGTLLYQTLSKL